MLNAKTAPSIITEVNPYLSTLWQINSKCKIRGNFLSEYTRLCNQTADKQFAEGIADESYSVHVMKAISASVYGILGIIDSTGSSEILFERDDYNLNRFYEKLLESNIPATLETKDKVKTPFTEKTGDSTTWGNGNVGYIINQIQLRKLSKTVLFYNPVAKTGTGIKSMFENTGLFEFYKKDEPKADITSTKASCQKTSMTTSIPEPVTAAPEQNGTLIAVIVIVAILAIALIVVVVLFFVLSEYSE